MSEPGDEIFGPVLINVCTVLSEVQKCRDAGHFLHFRSNEDNFLLFLLFYCEEICK